MQYPFKIKASAAFITELYWCEHGRYEDATNAREAGDTETIKENNYEVVACDFLERWKSQIEVRNDAELVELYYACASGTIGVHGKAAAANRILDIIRPRVREIDPAMVRSWPFQDGC